MRVKQNNEFGPIRAPENDDFWRPTTAKIASNIPRFSVVPVIAGAILVETPFFGGYTCIRRRGGSGCLVGPTTK